MAYYEYNIWLNKLFRLMRPTTAKIPRRAIPECQNFGSNFVSLPFASPRLPGRRLSQFRVEVEFVDVDALMSGKGSVT